MKIVFSCILFFISTNLISQQTFRVTGAVLDNKNNVIEIGEVFLYDAQDNLVKKTTLKTGAFEFSQLTQQKYYLQIINDSIIQKEPLFQLLSDTNFVIRIKEKFCELAQLSVTAKRKIFDIQNGNIIVDIANSPLNKLATSTDLLSKLPFVSLNANGEGVSMVGKGVPLLYVDNQKVDFSTLTSLSVDDIKSIEIIRNPSAKYEAEGRAVIKVILKKSKKEGYKITLNETAVFNRRFSNNFSINYQQKKNKTEWKMNAGYNQIQHWESNGFDYSVPSKNIISDYIIQSITNRPQIILGANLYQAFNEGDYITLAINGNLRPDKGDNNTVTNYSENNFNQQVLSLNHEKRKRATINSIFNYNKQIKSIDANILTGFQYTRESNNADYDFYNNYSNTSYVFNQFRKQIYTVNAFSGRIDVDKKIKKDYQLSFGASFIKAESVTDNLTDYRNTNAAEYFNYVFKELNFASYAELSAEKEKFSFKGGIRMETTSANGFNQTLNETNINRNYVDWFPKAELSYKPNKDYTYTINFDRSILRPSYADLASGALYASPYIEYDGNPNLLPTYTYTISTTASLKKWSLNASVYESINPMGYSIFYIENKNISKFSALNFEKEIGESLGLDVPFEYKFLTSQNSLSINYSTIKDPLAVFKKSTPYLYFYTNNTIKLKKGFNFLLDGSWITKRTQGIYEYNEMILLNLGITKSISNVDFTLRYNDVFQQNNFIQKLSYDKIITKGSFYGNTPTFSIGIKYNFGKVSNSGYKEKQINQNVNRI